MSVFHPKATEQRTLATTCHDDANLMTWVGGTSRGAESFAVGASMV